jgi:hypothetical protein
MYRQKMELDFVKTAVLVGVPMSLKRVIQKSSPANEGGA